MDLSPLLLVTFYLTLPVPEPYPELHEINRFPALAVVQSYIDFNHVYRQHCYWCQNHSIGQDEADKWFLIVEETEECEIAWRELWNAWNPALTDLQRRVYLQRLKEAIGEVKFFAGTMPDPVPMHRFQKK